MMLVTGGTGTLGRPTVRMLRTSGHELRVLSRTPGPGRVSGELTSGEGVPEALAGVDTVLHLANGQLKEAAQTARLVETIDPTVVRHLFYISIVGVDRNPVRLLPAEARIRAARRDVGHPVHDPARDPVPRPARDPPPGATPPARGHGAEDPRAADPGRGGRGTHRRTRRRGPLRSSRRHRRARAARLRRVRRRMVHGARATEADLADVRPRRHDAGLPGWRQPRAAARLRSAAPSPSTRRRMRRPAATRARTATAARTGRRRDGQRALHHPALGRPARGRHRQPPGRDLRRAVPRPQARPARRRHHRHRDRIRRRNHPRPAPQPGPRPRCKATGTCRSPQRPRCSGCCSSGCSAAWASVDHDPRRADHRPVRRDRHDEGARRSASRSSPPSSSGRSLRSAARSCATCCSTCRSP